MVPTAEQNELLEEALWGHNYNMEGFADGQNVLNEEHGTDVFREEYETKGAFASLAFFNLLDPLTKLHETVEAEGQASFEGVSLRLTTKPERKSIFPKTSEKLFSFDIFPDDADQNVPAYRIAYYMETLKSNVLVYSAEIERVNPKMPNEERPETVGKGSFIENQKKEDVIRYSCRSGGQFVVFSEFVKVMNMLKPVLNGHVIRTDVIEDISTSNGGAVDVVNADGGLPGELSLYTVDRIRTEIGKEAMPWLASNFDKVYAGLAARDLTWNNKMLVYNDLDDHVFIIPTSNPLQRSIFHENVSLNSDFSAHIILTQTNDEGQNTEIKIYPVDRYVDFLPEIIDGIGNGSIDREPMIQFDLTTKTFIHFSDECPDLLDMAVFSSTCDLEQINDGEADKKKRLKTDFQRYYEEPECDLDDEEISAPSM